MSADSPLLDVARAGKPHGLKGELKIWPLTPGSETLLSAKEVFLRDSAGKTVSYNVRGCRSANRHLIVALEGIRYRDEADALKGHILCVPEASLPDLEDEDEYYLHQLMDTPVHLKNGACVGRVTALYDNGASDVIVLANQEGIQYMVPFVESIVLSVEPGQRIVIDPPEGLLEATESRVDA